MMDIKERGPRGKKKLGPPKMKKVRRVKKKPVVKNPAKVHPKRERPGKSLKPVADKPTTFNDSDTSSDTPSVDNYKKSEMSVSARWLALQKKRKQEAVIKNMKRPQMESSSSDDLDFNDTKPDTKRPV